MMAEEKLPARMGSLPIEIDWKHNPELVARLLKAVGIMNELAA